ncbi:MAG: LuxR C-terminal-related transcriptional regulator [Armatimonadota bacterium]
MFVADQIDQGIDLEVLSKAELVAMNRVLMRMFDWTDPHEFVRSLFCELKSLFDVHECALYVAAEDGAALKLDINTGDGRKHLPDIVPHTSDLYCAILSGRRASAKSVKSTQLHLFDEWPDCIFRPIFRQSSFAACLALAHADGSVDLIDMILTQAVTALERFWRPQGQQDRPVRSDTSFDNTTRLTTREVEVLSLMADGLSNKHIAERLYISVATCKRHVENVLSKLEVHSRCAAASIWLARSEHRQSSLHSQFGP